MPRPALGQPASGQPTPANQAVLGQRIDGVLTAGRDEPTRRRAQRRDHVPIQLDHKDSVGQPLPIARSLTPRQSAHRSVPASSCTSQRRRSSCSSRAEIRTGYSAVPGSPPCRTGADHRARRAQRAAAAARPVRSTAEPTDFAMTSPTRGPSRRPALARRVDDQIGLNGTDPLLHRRVEVRRPRHPVAAGSTARPARGSGS